MSWTRKQFNPEAKHLTLTNVKANPEIQNLSQNPHVSNPCSDIPISQLHTTKKPQMIKSEEGIVCRNVGLIHFDYT